jgi:hypothetical protein
LIFWSFPTFLGLKQLHQKYKIDCKHYHLLLLFLGAGASKAIGYGDLKDQTSTIKNELKRKGCADVYERIEGRLARANKHLRLFDGEIDLEVILSILNANVYQDKALLDSGPFTVYVSTFANVDEFHSEKVKLSDLKRIRKTIGNALRGRDIRIVPNKGYSSLTFIWENCKRLQQVAQEEPKKKIHIRYFGDFDPSGEDMDRDIVERIEMIKGWSEGDEFDFERIAVAHKHIERYGLPEMPEDQETKDKYDRDPRKNKFEEENGGSYAVELDALAVYAPDDYIKMIQDTVDNFYDEEIYNAELDERSTPEFRQNIRQMVYDKTKEFLDNYVVEDPDDTSDDSEDGEE